MNFISVINTFTKAVENNNGAKLASLFTEDGIYDDYIYGPFKGRKNIELMIRDHFYSDAKDFLWEMYDPISKGNIEVDSLITDKVKLKDFSKIFLSFSIDEEDDKTSFINLLIFSLLSLADKIVILSTKFLNSLTFPGQ